MNSLLEHTTNRHSFHEVLWLGKKVLRWKEASNFCCLYCIFGQLLLSKYHLDNLADLCSLFIIIPTGQRDDTISVESRRHRNSAEESHSPKAANGTAIRPASVSSSNYGSISAFPKLVSEVNQELLTSGAVILPGRRQVTWTQYISCFHLDPPACLQTQSIVLYCMFVIYLCKQMCFFFLHSFVEYLIQKCVNFSCEWNKPWQVDKGLESPWRTTDSL